MFNQIKKLLQHNSLSELHDGQNIFFCKTDYLDEDLKCISKLKNKVVLITGNSAENITDAHVAKAPPNIKKWFCQHIQTKSNLVEAIPLGLENIIECSRKGHGVAWGHAEEKHHILSDIWSNPSTKEPSRLIYGNFNISTSECRPNLRSHAKSIEYITWDEPTLSYSKFVEEVLDHEAVLCPSGNGIDTHRFYETLYLGRIPIVCEEWWARGDFLIDKLYKHFPILLINEGNLHEPDWLKENIERIKSESYDSKYLDLDYWKNYILTYGR